MKGISERKQQVISTSERLFSQKGYLATSVRDLAQELNMEAASLYSHVKSKEDLLWNIASRCADEFFSAVEPISKEEVLIQEKLTRMIVAHIEVIARNLNASSVFFREWRHLSEPRKSQYSERQSEYELIFRKVVRQGIEENLFKHYDAGFSTRTILSAINWTHTWYRPDGDLSPREIGEQLSEFLLNGLIRSSY